MAGQVVINILDKSINAVDFVTRMIDDPEIATKTRYIIRLRPIVGVAFPDLDGIEKTAKKIVPVHFPADATTGLRLCVDIKQHGILKDQRDAIFEKLHEQVPRPPYRISFKDYENMLYCEFLPQGVVFCVMPGAMDRKKYNIHSLYGKNHDGPKH